MKFRNSPYCNEEFLGKYLYNNANSGDEIFTVQEYFGLNDIEKEYLKEGSNIYNTLYSYKLKVYDEYYELDCQDNNPLLFLVFDKPVHIVGEYCEKIIAPEIIIKNSENTKIYRCVSNKVTIDNNYKNYYEIINSKFNNTYFYDSKIRFWNSEINNFFIFDKDLRFMEESKFLNYSKIKCFGACKNIKEKILKYKGFKKGIIHIE